MKRGNRSGIIDQMEEMAQQAKEYSDLQLYLFKLKMTESLSLLFSKLIYSIILIVILATAAIFTLSAGAKFIGELLNSEAMGTLIVVAILLSISLILYLKRGKFMVNRMVKLISSLLLDQNSKESYHGK